MEVHMPLNKIGGWRGHAETVSIVQSHVPEDENGDRWKMSKANSKTVLSVKVIIIYLYVAYPKYQF